MPSVRGWRNQPDASSSASSGGRGVLGGYREMGKGSGWEQPQLRETRERGWGLQRARAVLCSLTPPAHQHPSRLAPSLRKQMNFPSNAIKALTLCISWNSGAFEPFQAQPGSREGSGAGDAELLDAHRAGPLGSRINRTEQGLFPACFIYGNQASEVPSAHRNSHIASALRCPRP